MALEADDGRLMEEAEWARQVRRGDQDALVRLYEAYFDRVYHYFYDMVDSISEAEVLTAETFHLAVNALMSDYSLWQGEGFGFWLYGLADRIFEEHSHASLTDDLKLILERNESAGEGEDVLNFIVQQEEQKILWQLVYELQPLEQQILLLYHRSKLSYAAIAMQLGCCEQACEQLYVQALENLKGKVQTYGLWSEARGG